MHLVIIQSPSAVIRMVMLIVTMVLIVTMLNVDRLQGRLASLATSSTLKRSRVKQNFDDHNRDEDASVVLMILVIFITLLLVLII